MDDPAEPPQQAPAAEGLRPPGAEPTAPSKKRRRAKSEPFWNSKGFIAFLALIAAAIAPTVAWIGKKAELQLAKEEHKSATDLAGQEQRHKIRMDYFSRAIDPSLDASIRQRVLRFLRRSKDDTALRSWAEEELRAVDSEVEKLRTEREAALRENANLRSANVVTSRQAAAERVAREAAQTKLASASGCLTLCGFTRIECREHCPVASMDGLVKGITRSGGAPRGVDFVDSLVADAQRQHADSQRLDRYLQDRLREEQCQMTCDQDNSSCELACTR